MPTLYGSNGKDSRHFPIDGKVRLLGGLYWGSMCPLEISCLTRKRWTYKERALVSPVETSCKKERPYWFLTLRWLVSAAGNVECTLKRKRHDSWTPTSAVAKAVQKRTSQILVVLGCGSQKQQPSRTSPRPEEQGVWKLYVDGRRASC